MSLVYSLTQLAALVYLMQNRKKDSFNAHFSLVSTDEFSSDIAILFGDDFTHTVYRLPFEPVNAIKELANYFKELNDAHHLCTHHLLDILRLLLPSLKTNALPSKAGILNKQNLNSLELKKIASSLDNFPT